MPHSFVERLWTVLLIAAMACLCLLLGARLAHAATYYVDKTGSDSHTCDQAKSAGTARATVNAVEQDGIFWYNMSTAKKPLRLTSQGLPLTLSVQEIHPWLPTSVLYPGPEYETSRAKRLDDLRW
jgi:hypothetical protein